MRPLLLTPLLLVACHPDLVNPGDTADTAPVVEAHLAAAPVFDPILGGPLAVEVSTVGDPVTTVEVRDAHGAPVATVEGTWDGRDASGAWAPVGSYTLHLTATRGPITLEDEHAVRVVRCGVLEAWAEGDEGASATAVPLWWHESGTLQGPEVSFTSADALEDAHGAAVELSAPGDELGRFPEGGAVPVAFTWDSRPILTLQLGDESVLGGAGLAGAGVRLEVEGWEPLAGATALDPATPVVLQAADPLGAGPGVLEETLHLRYMADDNDGVAWEIGEQSLPVRWYLLLADPTGGGGGPQAAPWVAAIDPALRTLDGVEPTDAAVISALVTWIYDDLGLSYDTRYGASYYTEYRNGWGPGIFDLTSFLRYGAGHTVNCSDCASILTAWAKQLGAPLQYAIVLENFDLNYILAIGGESFTHCPFGGWGCSFSYHAVTTNDEGQTIWDATLALDGDADPGHTPCEQLMVQGLDGEEYLDRLAMSGRVYYGYFGETLLQ
ncbi:MAG: hypothetical protein ABIO70_33040 [Pseudomonadota bacterium]